MFLSKHILEFLCLCFYLIIKLYTSVSVNVIPRTVLDLSVVIPYYTFIIT